MKKPLHKHIGHHAKRIHRTVTKYLYERDTIFATLWVFVFIILLGSIPLNLGVINPIKLSLKDFDFNDLGYSKLHIADNTNIDENIRIINIGQADREELAMMIDKASTYKPKVMALDVLFYTERDPHKDSMLNDVFSHNKNLITARALLLSGKNGDTVDFAGNYFKSASTYAHVNLFNDSLSSVRYHEPFLTDYKGTEYKSFSASIIEAYDHKAYEKFEKKAHHKILINYSRRR